METQDIPLPRQPEDRASAAEAVEGQVLVDGPKGLAVAFTPAAALRSAEAIAAAARHAEQQIANAPIMDRSLP